MRSSSSHASVLRVAALLLVSCHAGAQVNETAAAARPSEPPPNVVLIVIDTLRADRVSSYGYARRTTPEIDAFAARGLRFERAYGTAPWTLPSTTSLLTGLLPDVHRATNFLSPVSPQAELLAQKLAAEGYLTAAFIGNYFVQSFFGLDRGFGSYNGDCLVDRSGSNSDKISDHALDWLAQPHAKPFFLYLHYFDPHYNYFEHDGFKFGGEDTDRVRSGEDIYELRENLKHFDAKDRARLDALYDSEVAFTDHHVGRVFKKLDELGLTPKTLVVVTADHGEGLGEHGWIGHTIQLYEEAARVPLIVAGPGVAAGVADGPPIQLDDVEASLLALVHGASEVPWAKRPAGPHGLHEDEALICVQTTGIDEPDEVRRKNVVVKDAWKLRVTRGEHGDEQFELFKTDEPKGKRKKKLEDFQSVFHVLLDLREDDFAARKKEFELTRETRTARRALVSGTMKLIADEVTGACELYDLAADPHETHDLAKEAPEKVAALKRRLDQIVVDLAAVALHDADPISGAVAEKARHDLEATGYVHERQH